MTMTTETTTVRYLWRLRCKSCGFVEENHDENFIRDIASKLMTGESTVAAGDRHHLVVERCPLIAWELVVSEAVRD